MEMRVQLRGKSPVQTFLQSLFEIFDRTNCDDGSRELIPIFHNPHRKGRSSASAVALTLEYLEGVPSKAAKIGREKKQVRINIQETLEYLECGNQVDPKASPLQSLFAGEVTNASYQPCS